MNFNKYAKAALRSFDAAVSEIGPITGVVNTPVLHHVSINADFDGDYLPGIKPRPTNPALDRLDDLLADLFITTTRSSPVLEQWLRMVDGEMLFTKEEVSDAAVPGMRPLVLEQWIRNGCLHISYETAVFRYTPVLTRLQLARGLSPTDAAKWIVDIMQYPTPGSAQLIRYLLTVFPPFVQGRVGFPESIPFHLHFDEKSTGVRHPKGEHVTGEGSVDSSTVGAVIYTSGTTANRLLRGFERHGPIRSMDESSTRRNHYTAMTEYRKMPITNEDYKAEMRDMRKKAAEVLARLNKAFPR